MPKKSFNAAISFDVKNVCKKQQRMKQRRLGLFFGVVISGATVTFSTAAPANTTPPPAPPPLPAVRALKLEPASLHLRDGRDERRVLVLGVTEAGTLIDLTSQAKFQSDSTNVEINSQGYFRGAANGSAEVLVSAAGKEIKLPLTV